MKHTLKLLLTGLILAGTPALINAQVPQKFNYQGIARDSKGNPMGKQTLGIKLSVLPTSDATTPEYEEVQTITTNEFGLYTLQIGNGQAVTGTMAEVKWETGNKYIRVSIDPKGGSNYVDAGTTQLLSVPYAIYADKAGLAKETAGGTRAGTVSTSAAGTGTVNYLTKFTAANTIYNSQVFDNGTNIGIGTTTPATTAKVHINQNSANVLEHIRMQNLSAAGAGRFTLYSDGAVNYATFTKYGSTFAGGYSGITTLYPFANLLAFGNNGVAANDGLGRFLISSGGNIGVSLFKGGTSKLKFHADFTTENVGIGGNSAPVSRVHLNNTDGTSMDVRLTNNTTGHTANDGLVLSQSGDTATILNKEAGSLNLGTNNGIHLTVDTQGRVGLGTTPYYKLHVVNPSGGYTGYFESGTNDNFVGFRNAYGYIGYLGTYSAAANLDIGTSGDGEDVSIVTNASPKVTIKKMGNVGIGTTSPGMMLQVTTNSGKALMLDNPNTLGLNTLSGAFFKHGSHFTGALKTIGTSANQARMGLFVGANTVSDGNLVERVTISNNGYVGIGDTTPGYMLDVNGMIHGSSLYSDADIYNTNQQNYGNSYVDGYFDVDGNVDFASNLHVAGNTTNDGTLAVGGEMTVSSGNGIVKSNSGTQLRMGFSSGNVSATVASNSSVSATFNITPFAGTNSNIRVSVAQFQPASGSGTGFTHFIITPHDVDDANNQVEVTFFNAGSTSASFNGTLYLLCVATD